MFVLLDVENKALTGPKSSAGQTLHTAIVDSMNPGKFELGIPFDWYWVHEPKRTSVTSTYLLQRALKDTLTDKQNPFPSGDEMSGDSRGCSSSYTKDHHEPDILCARVPTGL